MIAEREWLRSQLGVLRYLEWIGIIAGFCLAVTGLCLWFLRVQVIQGYLETIRYLTG